MNRRAEVRKEHGPRQFVKAKLSRQETMLKQMGAKIEVVNSFLCYIRFEIDGIKIKYVYNVNRKSQYFLERIAPYPQPVGTFDAERDVVETIRHDIDQIRQMSRSSHFSDFFDLNEDIRLAARRMETLFLYYNLSENDIRALRAEIRHIHEVLNYAREHRERVYFETDPFCLEKKDGDR